MSESTLTEIYDLLSEIISPENKIKTVDQVNEKELLKLVQHISKEYFKQKKHTDSIISKLKENKDVLNFFEEKNENQFSSILKVLNYYQEKKNDLEKLNITLEKSTKEALEREKRLDEAQKIAKIGSWEIRIDTNETIWTKELYTIFEIEYLKGIDLVDEFKKKIHPEDIAFFENMSAFDPEKSNNSQEFRLICNSGIKTILATIYSNFEKGENRYTLGTFQDITEQKIAQQKIHDLEQIEKINKKKIIEAILLTKEREQKRIAEELHDDIGSSLMVIKLAVRKLSIPEVDKRDLYTTISDVVQKVRTISNELSPNILNEFGLVNALKQLFLNIENSSTIQIYFHSDIEELSIVTKEEEISLYRIIQELLNNILKYAEAKTIHINLSVNENDISITIEDDGKGFVPSKSKSSKNTLGLLNIESRIEYINASIKYSKIKLGGTLVKIKKLFN